MSILRQVRAEAKSDVPLQEKGWQEALEALAFDLKSTACASAMATSPTWIGGPSSRCASAGFSSAPRTSAISARGTRLSVRPPSGAGCSTGATVGRRARRLSREPHLGVQAAVTLEQIQLDYFKPISNRYNVGVRNGRLSLAGSVEYAPKITRLMLDRVLVQGVEIDYIHSARRQK